jgi:carbohydrate-selective porin OprB
MACWKHASRDEKCDSRPQVIANTLLLPRDETDVELYYKATITDWFELTADVQALEPAIRRNATTALVTGLRANIEF